MFTNVTEAGNKAPVLIVFLAKVHISIKVKLKNIKVYEYL